MATDLRVVVSTLRLAATFERMGDLAKHIAEAARRIYPEPALPAEATELFTEMQQFLSMTADRIVVMLQDRDAKTAEEIILDDDKLDALHHKTFDLALSDKWTGSRQQLIDVVLLGGEPGIGKSTLSLQIALADNGLKTLYVSGEESAEQIKMRALRLGIGNEGCLIYAETLLENILAQIEEQRPDLVVIDSIQTIYTDIIESSAGSVSQIRECAASLLKYAKATGTSIFIIGHITKDGTIAGPKILEHIVDVVLQFEGDNNLIYRILRGIKNRFGATFEIGVFEMLDAGLREVDNPSEILLSHYETPLSGIASSDLD